MRSSSYRGLVCSMSKLVSFTESGLADPLWVVICVAFSGSCFTSDNFLSSRGWCSFIVILTLMWYVNSIFLLMCTIVTCLWKYYCQCLLFLLKKWCAANWTTIKALELGFTVTRVLWQNKFSVRKIWPRIFPSWNDHCGHLSF